MLHTSQAVVDAMAELCHSPDLCLNVVERGTGNSEVGMVHTHTGKSDGLAVLVGLHHTDLAPQLASQYA